VSNKCISSVLYINLHLHVTFHIYILSVINKFIMYEFWFPYIPILFCKSFRSNFTAFPYFATVPTIAEAFTVSQGKLLLFPVNTTWCYVLSGIASQLFSLLDHPTIRGCQYFASAPETDDTRSAMTSPNTMKVNIRFRFRYYHHVTLFPNRFKQLAFNWIFWKLKLDYNFTFHVENTKQLL
jgi:hypothetical protein